ncbi:MAG: tripartite tricarboxylate transporter substrate binding protein [Betaproteobacteria bacterium]
MRFALLLCSALATFDASCGTFPTPGRPVRIVVGFAAGGGTDVQARLLAPGLAEALGVPVIVENRPGASTMLAAEEVSRAAPDGHTIFYTFSGTFSQLPHTQRSVRYDAFHDFAPISLAARGPLVLVVHPSVPASDVAGLVAWGKAHPGSLNVASFGAGTSSHLFAEMLVRQTGVAMTHVPYKGAGDAAKDLYAGRVQLMFDSAASALPVVRSGRLRAIGVVAAKRSRWLPDVPTLGEQGLHDMDLEGWLAFFGPANLPPEVVDKLGAAVARALRSPELKEAFAQGAYDAVASTPAELATLVRDDFDRWGRIVRELGFTPP